MALVVVMGSRISVVFGRAANCHCVVCRFCVALPGFQVFMLRHLGGLMMESCECRSCWVGT